MKRKPLILSLFIVFLISISVVAQPTPPDDPGGDPDVPITGIEILIGIGSLFGASRFLLSRKKTKDN